MDYGRRELKSARPAAREAPRPTSSVLGQLEVFDRGLSRRPRFIESVDLSAKAQILENREIGIQREPLRHVTDAFTDLPRAIREIEAENLPVAAVRFENPGKYSQRRALS